MVASQTEVESQTTVELSAEVFDAFCEDISDMFSVEVKCNRQQAANETVKSLKKRFKKLTAVNSIKAEGALDGTFQLIFDQEGLFTLGGVIFMLPEEEILKNRKRGSAKSAENMTDAITEAGSVMLRSWEKVFRKRFDTSSRFVQTNTFIGKPWLKPEEKIGLTGDEEFVFVPYEMTIGQYPAFQCGLIFPKTIFDGTAEPDITQAAGAEEKTQEKAQADTKAAKKTKAGDKVKSDKKAKGKADKKAQDKKPAAGKTPPTCKKCGGRHWPFHPCNKDVTGVADDTVEEKLAAPDEADEAEESAGSGVSQTIRKMTRSPAELPGEHAHLSLGVPAKDIMRKNVVWGDSDDSVQQALAKMQQNDVDYIMIGRDDGTMEGIVSKSDLAGATSPYLRPEFAKWRRPLDDATLRIKVKWIMSKPVRTIGLETPLTTMMDDMCRFSLHALPVVDQQDKVQGWVTVFDVFKALLKSMA